MKDYYKILSLTFGASDAEIKKQYRKLASVHHPDKNSGSKKSETTFKIIVNAYEILSNKEKRAIYDLKYKQYFQRPNSEQTSQFNPKNKHQNSKHYSPTNKEYQETEHTKTNNSFLWVVLLIILLIYLYNTHKTTTTGNPKADQQLEQQNTQERPESGELDF